VVYGVKRRVDCFVIFQGLLPGGPWTFVTRPGWRHCALLMTLYYPEPNAFAQRCTAQFSAVGSSIDLDVFWRTPENVAAEYARSGVTAIVKITVELPPARPFTLRGAITCVSVIKSALGIRDWKLITPRQLFLYLTRNGGEIWWMKDEVYLRDICPENQIRDDRGDANRPRRGDA
jgi:hypothetical protein